jgi:hypothetical protein
MNINGVDVLSVSEIAAELKISSSSATMRLRRRGVAPFAYLGCMAFYKQEDLEKVRHKLETGRASPNYGKRSNYSPQLTTIGEE